MDSVAIYKQEEIEMKGSLVIISFFIIGIAARTVRPDSLRDI